MAPEEAKVWGIRVPVSLSGRRKWPDELRAMAVQKILAGAGIRETAEEIGANKSLVALWVKNAKCSPDGPAFVEVVTPRTLPTPQPSMPVGASRENDASCKISVGSAMIEIPQGYPADHLVEILRAVRAAQ
ncbi:hypothetical protein [Arenibacterium sp. LLYu02]|uniref:hypothetical protein n=1 Tax=Arenibacterium sp. LLYu02 TaxID=3404132 RepID=UPI003B2206E3